MAKRHPRRLAVVLTPERLRLQDGDDYPVGEDDRVVIVELVFVKLIDAWGDETVAITDEMSLSLV